MVPSQPFSFTTYARVYLLHFVWWSFFQGPRYDDYIDIFLFPTSSMQCASISWYCGFSVSILMLWLLSPLAALLHHRPTDSLAIFGWFAYIFMNIHLSLYYSQGLTSVLKDGNNTKSWLQTRSKSIVGVCSRKHYEVASPPSWIIDKEIWLILDDRDHSTVFPFELFL